MFAVNLVRALNKPISVKLRTVVSTFKQISRNYEASKQPTSFGSRPQVKDDVVLFSLENPKFFIGLNIISAVQCGFWTYLGGFLFWSIDDPIFNFDGNKFWQKVLEKERQYSTALSAFSIFLGWGVLLVTLVYSVRSIRKITLHKDGKFITLVTYGLPGYNTFKIPLNNISSVEHRTKAKKFIPLRMKNSRFFYLVDIKGKFTDPTLFDFTVGVRRGF